MAQLVRSSWVTLLRASPHLLITFAITGTILMVVLSIVQARLLGDWGLLGLRDLVTPSEYQDAGFGGSVDLIRSRLWDRAQRSGTGLAQDAVAVWVLWFAAAAFCQTYAVAAVGRAVTGELLRRRELLWRAVSRFPQLLVAWLVISAAVALLVVAPTRLGTQRSWWLAAPILLLASSAAVVVLSRLVFVPVAAVHGTGHPFGLGWACCLRDGWRDVRGRWATTLARVAVVSALPLLLAVGVAVVLAVVALAALQIQVAVALGMLASVMVVTIGASCSAAVWHHG